ncbi:MAG: hypothetical protein IJ468_13740 [Lachnospiraceae bacterium]|nr:hypothetical protein [Lachnospiraceae bacterium]
MKMDSHLTTSIKDAGPDARYDQKVKEILSNKQVLARILKTCIPEFKHASIKKIISCIEDVKTGIVPIRPGKSNEFINSDAAAASAPRITGVDRIDHIENEGEIRFDIYFHAFTPPGRRKRVKLIINVEAQNNFYPGYELVPRGIYYLARMLSSQMDREFTPVNYNAIKKVYSIWICPNGPKKLQNEMIQYSFQRNTLRDSTDFQQRYDLADLKFIILPKDPNTAEETSLHRMLAILLSGDLSADEKLKLLQTKFGFATNGHFEKEVNAMCNLSVGIRTNAMKEGQRDGWQKGQRDAESKIIKLIAYLNDAGRSEDLNRALTDSVFRKELMKELNL